MKKLFMVFLIAIMATPSFSQTFRLRAGLNMSNMIMKDNDGTYSDDNKLNPGFHLGGTVEFPINDAFTFETGLLVSTTGFMVKESDPLFGEMKASATIYNLNIPLTVRVYVKPGSSGKFYFDLGPYVGIALSGKTKFTFDGNTEKTDIDIGSADTDDIKALDFGVLAGAGFEINSIQIGVRYAYGLANISTYTDFGTKISNRVLAVSVGYKFGAN